MPNVDSIWLKTKELLTYHYGCHSNLVTIAAWYVADAYHPKEKTWVKTFVKNMVEKNFLKKLCKKMGEKNMGEKKHG